MRPFRAILAQENVETQEGWMIREFPAGCFTWRALPLTLMAQVTTPEFGGHAGAFILGRIDTIDREGDLIVARGQLDDEGEGADADRRRDVIRQIGDDFLNGVSVDPGGVEVTETCEEWNEDEPEWCDVVRLRFDSYEIGAATATTVPALAGTLIELDDSEAVDEEMPDEEMSDEEMPDDEAVAAAASITVPSVPPRSFFEDPQLAELTRIPVVTPEGRVYGHLASWQDCHISFPSYCQPPWHSASSYLRAHVCDFPGGVLDDGGAVGSLAVMPLAVRGGHYSTQGDAARQWREAQAHYDNPENVAAYVRVYEDEIGIAFAGALRPGVTPEMIATFAAHQLSGDWRRIAGDMELVGACSVNVPGFVRSVALVASIDGGQLDTPVAAVITSTPNAGRACCDDCAHGQPCGSSDAVAAAGRETAEQQLARLQRGVDRLLAHLEPDLRAAAVERLRAGVRA